MNRPDISKSYVLSRVSLISEQRVFLYPTCSLGISGSFILNLFFIANDIRSCSTLNVLIDLVTFFSVMCLRVFNLFFVELFLCQWRGTLLLSTFTPVVFTQLFVINSNQKNTQMYVLYLFTWSLAIDLLLSETLESNTELFLFTGWQSPH